jgi:hypothetical protein
MQIVCSLTMVGRLFLLTAALTGDYIHVVRCQAPAPLTWHMCRRAPLRLGYGLVLYLLSATLPLSSSVRAAALTCVTP